MNKRLKELRSKLGLSQATFAERIGIKQTSYSDIETGRRELTERNLNLICREFNVDENWLRTGEGDNIFKLGLDEDTVLVEQFLNEYDNPLFSEIKSLVFNIMKVYNQLDPKSQQVIDDFIIKLKNEQNNNKND